MVFQNSVHYLIERNDALAQQVELVKYYDFLSSMSKSCLQNRNKNSKTQLP